MPTPLYDKIVTATEEEKHRLMLIRAMNLIDTVESWLISKAANKAAGQLDDARDHLYRALEWFTPFDD